MKDRGGGGGERRGIEGVVVAMRGLAVRRMRVSCGQGLDGGSVAGGGAVCWPKRSAKRQPMNDH